MVGGTVPVFPLTTESLIAENTYILDRLKLKQLLALWPGAMEKPRTTVGGVSDVFSCAHAEKIGCLVDDASDYIEGLCPLACQKTERVRSGAFPEGGNSYSPRRIGIGTAAGI